MIDAFVRTLVDANFDVGAEEIADILWLCIELDKRLQQPEQAETSPAAENIPDTVKDDTGSQADNNKAQEPGPRGEASDKPWQQQAKATKTTEVGLYTKTTGPLSESTRQASAVNIPAPVYLPGALELSRAFRPLMTRYKLATATRFDADATVQTYAQTRLLQPEFQADEERWFELALVIDHSSSMIVWTQTINEYHHLLSYQGAFRDVRRWQLHIKADDISITSESGLNYDTDKLLDRASRRLIMIVSDCVASHWYQKNIWQIIKSWSSTTPVVLVQLLSDSCWPYTALGSADTSIYSRQPGMANSKLEIIPSWWLEQVPDKSVPIPVINLEHRSTANWSTMLMGGNTRASGILLAPDGAQKQQQPVAANKPPEQRLKAFQLFASPLAYELAVFLSIVPLQLPVITLIQRAMITASTQMHLAEIFIGGILYQLTPEEENPAPENITYEFFPGVRELLQNELSRQEVLRTLHTVAQHIERTLGVPLQFSALIPDARGRYQLPEAAMPFAQLGAQVLSRLGFDSRPQRAAQQEQQPAAGPEDDKDRTDTSSTGSRLYQLKVFLSHSAESPRARGLLKRLGDALGNYGITVLNDNYDTTAVAGDWNQNIHRWLGECDTAVLLICEAALEPSEWLRREIAVLSWRKQIEPEFQFIVVLTEDLSIEELEHTAFDSLIRLSDVQLLRAVDSLDIAPMVNNIIAQLEQATITAPPSYLEHLARHINTILKEVDRSTLLQAWESLTGDKPVWQPELSFGEHFVRLAMRNPEAVLSHLTTLLDHMGAQVHKQQALELIEHCKGLWLSLENVTALAGMWVLGVNIALSGHYLTQFTIPCLVRRIFPHPQSFRLIWAGTASSFDDIRDTILTAYDHPGKNPADWPLIDRYKDPAFVLLESHGGNIPDGSLLREINQYFPHISIIIDLGPEAPDMTRLPSNLQLLQPAIDANEEQNQYSNYVQVLEVLGTTATVTPNQEPQQPESGKRRAIQIPITRSEGLISIPASKYAGEIHNAEMILRIQTRQSPVQVKKRIQRLFKRYLSGITITPLSDIPKEIPARSGFIDLLLHDKKGWSRLLDGFSFAPGREFTNTEVELWALFDSNSAIDALLAELDDPETPPERRLEIGDLLDAMSDPRKGVGLAQYTVQPTSNPEIQKLLDTIAIVETEPPKRLEIGDRLDELGDPRNGVGLDNNGLPDIDWVAIPPGPFTYGEGKTQRNLDLDSFYIARYPVTNAQYQAFIDAGGYQDSRWWQGIDLTKSEQSPWPQGNRPRTNINWFEAEAFCRWLSAQLDYDVHLPTEQQWEKACRGIDGRAYPWGNDYQSGYANVDETKTKTGPWNSRQTTAVGLYPQGTSPYGVQDMAGNVWEWCSNKGDKTEDRKIDDNGDRRVLRGGSCNFNPVKVLAAYRFNYYPVDRNYDIGFRLMSVLPFTGD